VAEGRKTGAERGRGRTTRRAAPFREARSDLPVITPEPCRFLARQDPDGTVREATPTVDPAHVCVALVDPVPQSGRQQELVCLTSAHVNCPRYLRGLLIANAPTPVTRRREQVSPAVIGATLLLLAAIAASFGFLAIRGGFELALASPSPIAVGAVPSASASAAAQSPSTGPESLVPSTAPSPSVPPPSSSPAPTPEPTPTPAATPARTPTPAPTSDRFALLTKCPSTPDCWIYTIRSGDNLRSIANYFGVSYNRVLAMNPNLRRPIHAGDKLRIPTPTR
jgi:hypothetical protein